MEGNRLEKGPQPCIAFAQRSTGHIRGLWAYPPKLAGVKPAKEGTRRGQSLPRKTEPTSSNHCVPPPYADTSLKKKCPHLRKALSVLWHFWDEKRIPLVMPQKDTCAIKTKWGSLPLIPCVSSPPKTQFHCEPIILNWSCLSRKVNIPSVLKM